MAEELRFLYKYLEFIINDRSIGFFLSMEKEFNEGNE